MAHLALYRKYRCRTFSDILGQEHVTRTLSNAILEDRVAHAYLFTGPRGTGKTSAARVLAKALNCEKGPTPDPCGECVACQAITDGSSMDVIEIDAASHSKVDETREVLAGVPLAAAQGRKKVYVIDEVHMMSTPAFNALLKTLEEPPDHVVFVLATTEAHKVLPTIVSRTQRFDFRRIPTPVLHDHLSHVAKLEGIEIEDAALSLIAQHADGGARDALSALDQLGNMGGPITTADADALFGDRAGAAYVEMFDAVLAGDIGAVFWSVHTLMSQGADARQLTLGALGHARSLLLLKTAPDAEDLLDVSPDDRGVMAGQAERFAGSHLLRITDLLGRSYAEMRNSPNHRLLLELALVRATDPVTDPDATGLLARIERLERRLGIEGDGDVQPPAVVPAPVQQPPRAKVEKAQHERVAPDKQPPGQSHPVGADAESLVEVPRGAEIPPAEKPDAAGPLVSLAQIRETWNATMHEVSRRSKRVWGLLSPSRPVRFENDVLVVEVQSEWHRDEMGRRDGGGGRSTNHEILAEALHSALGIRPHIEFRTRGQPPTPAGDDALEPSEAGSADPAGISIADVRDATNLADPVELVKQGLGGEVVEQRTGEAPRRAR